MTSFSPIAACTLITSLSGWGVKHYYYLQNSNLLWRGTGGREPGRIRAGGAREAGEGGTGCGSHARAGSRKTMKDIKFLNDFLVCFWANYQKSEPKNIRYLLF